MKIEIKHRYSGEIILCGEYESVKDCLEKNRGSDLSYSDLSYSDLSGSDLSYSDLSGSDLSYSNLSGSDLSYSNLSYSNLSGSNLRGSNLSGSNLRGSNLRGSNLRGSNLSGSDLSGSNLSYSNLSGSNLSGSNLSGSDLSGSDLSYSNLRGSNLRGSVGVNKHLCTPLTMLIDQPGAIRLYKTVTADGYGIFRNPERCDKNGIIYRIGETVTVDEPNTDDTEQCGAGVNVATLDWCMKEYKPGMRILIVEFTAADIACIPISTDGKIRLKSCKVVGEKDLTEIGLVERKTK
jgi:hypothetical protein